MGQGRPLDYERGLRSGWDLGVDDNDAEEGTRVDSLHVGPLLVLNHFPLLTVVQIIPAITNPFFGQILSADSSKKSSAVLLFCSKLPKR